jgi:hypothetical protein
VRLLTLTGPGGTGKTRLALEVSRALAARFPDGVWFVPLATVTDPAKVGLAVMGALRLANPSGRAWIDVVADRLRDWAALLVLDNFEHVAEAGPFVAELLARAPGIAVLATSRVVLGLTGEHEYPVRPLPSGEAATLFAQRARAVRPHWRSWPPWRPRTARWSGWSACSRRRRPSAAPAGPPLGDHQRSLLVRALQPASAALGRDVLAAADDLAGGRAMTFDQALDYAAVWAGQRAEERHAT